MITSVILSALTLFIFQPKNADWQIYSLQMPQFLFNFANYQFLPYLQFEGTTLISNPNTMGTHIHNVEIDVYLKMKNNEMIKIGIAESHDQIIKGRSINIMDTLLIVKHYNIYLLYNLAIELFNNNGVIPIIAIGKARVRKFLNFQVFLLCNEEIELNLLAIPYAQRIYDRNSCKYKYKTNFYKR